MLSDDIGTGNSENQLGADISLLKDITNSSYRLQFDAKFQEASQVSNLLSASPNVFEAKIFFQQKENDPIQWRAGVAYLSGNDAIGSTSVFYPVINLRTHLSHSFEIGAGFEPKPYLIGLSELLRTNLFYSPLIALTAFPNSNAFPGDFRRVVSEPIHVNVFANYFLSLDNQVHAEFRFIERNHEPVFDSRLDTKGHLVFITDAWNTRRIELEAGGTARLFMKDQFRTSILFRSAANRDGVQLSLPYEPTAQVQVEYQFGNISEKCIPQIEFLDLSRINHSFLFVNIEVPYKLSPHFQLKLRAENILGNAGDYWTGYNEYPRSVCLSARYSF